MSMISRVMLIAALLCWSGMVRATNLVDVELLARSTGTSIPTYWRAGERYAAGTPGERYTVRVTNRSGQRVLAVLSVDGVNAVSGETADPGQAGYVLDPWETLDVAGWRKSNQEVARFYFTSVSDSYASRTGRAANVGVIGVAAFQERPVAVPAQRVPSGVNGDRSSASPLGPMAAPQSDSASQPAPSSSNKSEESRSLGNAAVSPVEPSSAGNREAPRPAARAAPQNADSLVARVDPLGTGHGERERSDVRWVPFERATESPAELHTIWYDSREGLIRRGVIRRDVPPPGRPEPFPGTFVPDPPCCR